MLRTFLTTGCLNRTLYVLVPVLTPYVPSHFGSSGAFVQLEALLSSILTFYLLEKWERILTRERGQEQVEKRGGTEKEVVMVDSTQTNDASQLYQDPARDGTVLKVIKKVEYEVLCPQHNPVSQLSVYKYHTSG